MCLCSKLFGEFRWNFTWMIDGESPYSSWFSKTAAPPGGHFYIMSAILKFVYVNNFRAVCRNSMKLHTSDRWWEMPAPANFRTCLPTVAPPVGHLFFILYFFLLILKNVWRNSTHLHINDRWEKTQRPACFRTSSPTAVPSSGHFSFRYWLFVLMLKTVWRISMKLHMNGRWWELPKAADFRKHSSWAVPSGGHFYFTSAILKFFMLITSKPLHGIQRNFTQVIDGEWCQQQSISPGLQWHPLLAIFIRFLLFCCLFSKLFDQN